MIKETVPNKRPTGMQSFAFNLRRGDKFGDARVRQAIGLAFDFEWTNKNLFYGQYTRTESYFSNSELAATGLPSPDELKLLEPFRGQIPSEVFTQEFHAPKTDGSGTPRENLRKAQELLRAGRLDVAERRAGQPDDEAADRDRVSAFLGPISSASSRRTCRT